jgi:hypothetical protein
MRLIHELLSWLSVPDRWARWMVLKVVDRLVRLDYLLFEVVQALAMPADLERMRDFTVPESSSVRLASTLESVQSDYLRPAIQELWAVAQTSDVALRRELAGAKGSFKIKIPSCFVSQSLTLGLKAEGRSCANQRSHLLSVPCVG